MSAQNARTHAHLGSTLTLRSGGVTELSGEDIRRERLARGWSQARLAQLAGVSTGTVNRLEAGRDYKNPRLLPKVGRALGLVPAIAEPANPPSIEDDGPPLRKATAGQLVAELAHRLAEHELWAAEHEAREGHRINLQDRIRTGELPPGLSSRPDVGKGPRVVDDKAQNDS